MVVLMTSLGESDNKTVGIGKTIYPNDPPKDLNDWISFIQERSREVKLNKIFYNGLVMQVDREKKLVTARRNFQDYEVSFPIEKLSDYIYGENLKNVFPEMTEEQIAFLESGLVPAEIKDIF